jgi:FtsZ-interacting cell division protein ZipA
MNSLQVGLIAVGAVVVAVLAVLSWWQTRRKSTENTAAPVAKREVTATEHRIEVNTGTPEHVIAEANHVDVLDETLDEPIIVRRAPDTRDQQRADAKVDAHVRPAVDARPQYVQPQYVQAPAVPSPMPELVTTGMPFDERLHVCALIAGQDGQPLDVVPFLRIAGRASSWGRLFRQSPWEAIDLSQPTGAVHSLCLALPIASRGGPVTEAEFDAWRTSVAVECATQNCTVQFEGFTAAAERAAELDAFLAAVDCIPIIYLVRKDGAQWSGTRLRGTLEANGFRLQNDGRFAYHEVETEEAIFYAVDGYERAFTPERLRTESITAFRLVMEAALLKNPLQRFDAYRQTLRALSKLLDAELRDSSGAIIGEPEFTELRAQVQSSTDALTAADIAPGSPSALALFG